MRAEEERQKQREMQKQKNMEKRSQRRHGRKREEEPETEIAPEPLQEKTGTGIEDLDVKDILGKGEKEDELGALDEDLDKDEFSLSELEEKPVDANKCQNCSQQTEKQVFCPECGQAFCEKCAKTVKQVAGRIEMTCPKCGARIKK